MLCRQSRKTIRYLASSNLFVAIVQCSWSACCKVDDAKRNVAAEDNLLLIT